MWRVSVVIVLATAATRLPNYALALAPQSTTPAPEPLHTSGSRIQARPRRPISVSTTDGAYALALQHAMRNVPKDELLEHIASAESVLLPGRGGGVAMEAPDADTIGSRSTCSGYYLQLRHAGILKQLPTQKRVAHELNIVRSYSKEVRDREHGGDSHRHFGELDRKNDNHLDHGELLALLGPDTVRQFTLLAVQPQPE